MIHRFHRLCVLSFLLATLAIVGLAVPCMASELPQTVLAYLRKKDPMVKVRFDGMVTFSNHEVYLPVFPQDPSRPPNPSQVLREYPGSGKWPDLIQFDNHFFLIRLVNTASGKLALARMDAYPIELKEGLLPQDLLLPPNLFLPNELKVILGDLPYHPMESVIGDENATAALAAKNFTSAARDAVKKTLYVADLDRQALAVIEPTTGQKRESVELNCVASNVLPSPDGHSVFVSCLTTDEVVVVDTRSSLVRTRILVGAKPTGLLYLPSVKAGGRDTLAVSHRFSNFLTLIPTDELISGAQVQLPGNGGPMAALSALGLLYVADYTENKLYELDLASRKLARTLPGLRNMSALWIEERTPGSPVAWMISRAEDKLQGVDLRSGEVVANIAVGKKPVAMAECNGKLYIVSAGGDLVDVIDLSKRLALRPISLSDGSFPTAIVTSAIDQRAYLTAAGTDHVFVLDLNLQQLEKALSLNTRGAGIALVGNPTDGAAAMMPSPPTTPTLR